MTPNNALKTDVTKVSRRLAQRYAPGLTRTTL
jgi:hypothetical protein